MMNKKYFLKTLGTFKSLIQDTLDYEDVVLDQYYGALKHYPESVWMEAQANILRGQEYRRMPLIGTFIKACEEVKEVKRYALKHPHASQLQIEDKDAAPPTPEEHAVFMAQFNSIINKASNNFTI
jgi:hypothetical protein